MRRPPGRERRLIEWKRRSSPRPCARSGWRGQVDQAAAFCSPTAPRRTAANVHGTVLRLGQTEGGAMRRLNVTLAIEEELLNEARAVAAKRRTSVNEMVREFLKDVVSQESRRLAALERIQPFLDRPSVRLGSPRPSRDELHER